MKHLIGSVCCLLAVSCSNPAPSGRDATPQRESEATTSSQTGAPPTPTEATTGTLSLADMPLDPRDHQVVALPKGTAPETLLALSKALRENEALQACAERHPEAFHGQGGAAVLTFVALHPGLVRGPSLQHYMISPPELRRPSAREGLEQCARAPLESVAQSVTLPASGLVVGYIWRPLNDPSVPREPEGGLSR